jgi:acetyl-CoA carboxylase carboxyl transferase subunit beta
MVLFSKRRPCIKVQQTKKDGFSGWLKCSSCTELIHEKELEQNHNCCKKCGYHYRLPSRDRIQLLADSGTFKEMFTHISTKDILGFVDSQPYQERIDKAQKSSGESEAAIVGCCTIDGLPVALGILNFSFMGGSMGSVVGERLTSLIEHATQENLPLVLFSSSGGARMQESIFSLMQMAKTSAALAKFHEKGLFYLSVLTNPTTGGVTASFATLGDIIIAEPNALIAFAGPRVVEQTIRQKLPAGAQRSEFVLEHGLIDCIVDRSELNAKIVSLLRFFHLSKQKNTQVLHKSKDLNEKLEEMIQTAETHSKGVEECKK